MLARISLVTRRISSVVLIAACLLAPALWGAGPALDFFDSAAVRTKAATGTTISLVERDGRRVLRAAGAAQVEVSLEPARGHWDFSFHTDIAATLHNFSDAAVSASLRIENGTNTISGSADIAAGQDGVLEIPLTRSIGHLADGSEVILIGMRSFPWATSRKPARPKIDPREVTGILLTITGSKAPVRVEVARLELTGSTVVKPATGKPLFPLFDEFGQYIHWEWPGKIHSIEDMRRSQREEAKDLASHPRPADWDRYGGWATGPTFKATGAFRTEKYRGKWWLVDPEGKLFFSYGPACVQLHGDPTIVDRREKYFAWMPSETDPRYRDFFSSAAVRDDFDFGTRSVRAFSFLGVNLLRKYGDNWREESAELAHRRVASWAMNTMGNWSDLEVCRLDHFYPNRRGRTPYTMPVHIIGAPRLRAPAPGNFHDPFDPGFAEAVRRGMRELAELTAQDPWCIGYFVENEVPWNGQNIFRGVLESPPEQPAKAALMRFLQQKYGTVEHLNAAWKTELPSWQAFLSSRALNRAAVPGEDVDAFYRVFMQQYFKAVRGAVKQVAPKHLYLGCRFAAWSKVKTPALAAAKYADVVSVNFYATPKEMAAFTYPDGLDVPVVVSEWHFGARDRGQFDCGMQAVANQRERAEAFQQFMRAALAHPLVVGAHWFRYHDHPSAGRADGESRSNSQNGLLDPTDSPYQETIEAARSIGHMLYQLRAGQQ